MERVSDNADLELNWPAIPDSIRLFLRRERDSPQQLDFRVHMFMHDALYGRVLRSEVNRSSRLYLNFTDPTTSLYTLSKFWNSEDGAMNTM
jgi:hypothetical protein